MNFDLEKERRGLDRKLEALRKKEFIPAALLDIVARTAQLQLEARAKVQVTLPAGLTAADTHAQGAPLLPREHFPYDKAVTAETFGKLLALMAASGGSMAAGAQALHKALEAREFSLEEACSALLQDDQLFFADWSARMPEAPSFVRFLVQGSMVPSLMAVSDLLAQQRDTASVWAHGHCPHCGSMPLVASLKQKEGFRYLTCSLCRHEYRAKRLQCPFCGEDDHKKLEYFKAEGEPGFEVHVCRSCHCYLKTSDFRDMDRQSVPVLDDLESLALDILAREQGFVRPTQSAWGF
ncbi:formate dehydrogenase accessory protein [Oleidesulfovibrio alaskensis G20]|jgi:FdhE protein|uniref:Formate dehydrogenase accessory protein n=1 Tax=Oleidesulfovibrio alaskensis (strain ATCC BAA-1058 / DSM 17464 / G20) TaxID=207559 RepID=Q314Y9_OLEA2|nr:formate dehydrogenase accessory protein FdhE [Oleidesulfovibrio alaskensis]ABB37507.1 formate dehydrogenase accessory protein [Oleidesulfovibrio alaskensis G20]MBG0773193.1 formate dehydrogenase accessory protein FdhE [Oleidesulfovibrio alaskensis]MBL3581403.1 formate dehydrogenase accessory protein FdhE [Oleidesulfovibrio alaskensis]